MAKTREFSREFMEDNDYPYSLMDCEFYDKRRWYDIMSGVFEFEGNHYRVFYADPATEMQDGIDPWFDEDSVMATEVVRLPVVEYKWVEVSD